MKQFFLVFLLVNGFSVLGQIANENTNSNGVTNTAVPVPQEAEKMDTLLQEKESSAPVIYRTESKKAKVSTVSRAASVDVMKEESISTSDKAAENFSYSKTKSASNRTQRSPSKEYQDLMDASVKELEKTAPESFEYHFYKYQSGNYNTDLSVHLNKAEELKPNNSDVHIQKVAYSIIVQDTASAKVYLDKMEKSDRLSDEVIMYTEDLLQSVPEKGALITHGLDDTYGVYYNQINNDVRNDVTVVSLDFMQSPQLREQLKNKGFNVPQSEVVDVAYMNELCETNKDKSWSISMTVPKEYLSSMKDKLFVEGLTFKYSEDLNYNNFYRNDYLWSEVLTMKLADQAKSEKGKQLSSNYLPMLLQLSKFYQSSNETDKRSEVDKDSEKISVQCNKYEQVKKIKSSYR
jgi:hypothetical protein